jgi:sugar (pentulose or hexulose) kinase
LVNTFSGFSQNSFEKWHVAACRFSKELCEYPRNTPTNRMRGIAISCLQKSFINSKAFGVKWLKTY